MLNQDKMNNLSRPITNKITETTIKRHSAIKCPGSDGFSTGFYQSFKEDLPTIFFQLLKKKEKHKTLLKSL